MPFLPPSWRGVGVLHSVLHVVLDKFAGIFARRTVVLVGRKVLRHGSIECLLQFAIIQHCQRNGSAPVVSNGKFVVAFDLSSRLVKAEIAQRHGADNYVICVFFGVGK